MSTKIFVITHKEYAEPDDTKTYSSMQVGSAINGRIEKYLCDDIGENISARNDKYAELTGLYWIWKNYLNSPACEDNIGLCHYRRYFSNEMGERITSSQADDILAKYDMIVSQTAESGVDAEESYRRCHNINDLQTTIQVVTEYTPQFEKSFHKVLKSRALCSANLMITNKKLMAEYCEWLFPVLFNVEKRIDISSYDDYHKRVFGFLSEILHNVWIEQKQLKIYKCPILLTGEKTETVQIKKMIRAMMDKGQFENAETELQDMIKKRPDIMLAESDFDGEIRALYTILTIIRLEKSRNENGILKYSSNTEEMLAHYRKVETVLTAIEKNTATESDLMYLLRGGVSGSMKEMILTNSDKIKDKNMVATVLGL